MELIDWLTLAPLIAIGLGAVLADIYTLPESYDE